MRASFENPPDDVLREILARPKTFAVVGCSPDPRRDSHRVAALLLALGHEVVPVHPAGGEILGRPVAASLAEVYRPIDVVDVFRKPEAVPEIAREAIEIGARVLWLQLGVVDEPSARRARSAGLTVVMDRCPAIEHRRLFPPALPLEP